jgi:pectate lyase
MLGLLLAISSAVPTFNITQFGASPAPGDDTAAFQKAFEAAREAGGGVVVVPKGTFEMTVAQMYSNTELKGEDRKQSVIRMARGQNRRMLMVNPLQGKDAATRPNPKNVTVRNLTFRGNNDTEEYIQHCDLLTFNGVDDGKVIDVDFIGYRGDGLYIGGGDAKELRRHNNRILVQNCLFDGVNRRNRNAIGIIDATDLTIEGCTFVRTSNERSPGPLDIEPNKNAYHRAERIVIRNNTFRDNGGNSIMLDIAIPQAKLERPARDILIENNSIDGASRRGILLNHFSPMDPTAALHRIVVRNNVIRNAEIALGVEGLRGVEIYGNRIENCPIGFLIGYGRLGHGAADVRIFDNTFDRVGFGPGSNAGVAIVLTNVDRVTVERNRMSQIAGPDGRPGTPILFKGGQGGGRGRSVTLGENQFNGRTLTGDQLYRVHGSYQLDRATLRTPN